MYIIYRMMEANKEAKFESKGDVLYINGKKVLKGWESFSGMYWFALEKIQEQDSYMGELPDGTDDIAKGDTIWNGLVQGPYGNSFGDFSQAELERMRGKVWKIPQKNLSYSGRRN